MKSIDHSIAWTYDMDDKKSARSQYTVKAQTSLAPLSWFPGSHIPNANVHQCCRIQSYANSHAIPYEIDERNLHSTKCLGVLIDDELNWSSHVDKITKTTQRNISVIRRAKFLEIAIIIRIWCCHILIIAQLISISNHSTTKSSKEGSKIDYEPIIRNPFSRAVYKFEMDDTIDERFEFNPVMMIYNACIILHHHTSNQIW